MIRGLTYSDLGGGLYVGSHPRSPEHVAHLADVLNIRQVVNLQTDEDMRELGVRWELLWRALVNQGLEVHRCPITDFQKEALRHGLSQAVGEVEASIKAGGTVYLHCTAGLNRAPSVALAYLAGPAEMGLAEALTHLYDHHRCQPLVGVVQSWLEENYPDQADV